MAATGTVVIGAGIGGMVAALELALAGEAVTVVEAEDRVGGKLRQIRVGEHSLDSGPTVFTMRWVFDALFAAAGSSLEDELQPRALEVLASHYWQDGSRLDLYADRERSAAAIGEFAGACAARQFLRFCQQTQRMYSTLEQPFLRSQQPSTAGLSLKVLRQSPLGLLHIHPFRRMAGALAKNFTDPRLRQLYGRYATYCGSSPYQAPATLMLIANVEQQGVWQLRGGMQSLADALYRLASAQGVKFHLKRRVAAIDIRSGKVSAVRTETGDVFPCEAVICNADPAAVRQGLLGDSARNALPQGSGERSLSAVTWGLACTTGGINLAHHNVFFSPDYRQEFRELLEHQQLPGTPTVYICAQDRGSLMPSRGQTERLLCLVNAPARGDSRPFTDEEIATCATRTFQTLARCGLQLTAETAEQTVTTPNDFTRRFPGTGGALYGQASHGWRSSFSRPGARTRIPGLYLAGGGTHPGPGVPMAALSGKLAAQSRLADRASTVRCQTAATAGGTSTL